jgi:hypothetical protein
MIGWREWLKLPALGVEAIKAKVDTGARSSALHAFELEEFLGADNRPMVRFKVHPFQRDLTTTVECVAELIDRRQVRSSHGHETLRPVILTTLELGGERYEIEVTLAARDAMGFRMLLGREAVRGRFVIDPNRSFITGRRKVRRKKKKRPKER